MSAARSDILIAGAGLAGLFTALSLARRGVKACLFDPALPGGRASWAAAGMLGASFELASEPGPVRADIREIFLLAREAWHGAGSRLAAESGVDIGYRDAPTLVLAPRDGAEAAWLDSLAARLMSLDLPFRRVTASGAPGLELPLDGQVDNRAVIRALEAVLSAQGVTISDQPLESVLPGAVPGSVIVDARGWRSPGCRPVKGTALSLAPHPGLPAQVVRFGACYVVPKSDRVILGATSAPGRSDTSVNEQDIAALLADAARHFPAVAETAVTERWSGIRPQTPDGLPVLGWIGEGRLALGGFHRNGVLLAPLLGEWAAAMILGEGVASLARALDPRRLEPSLQ